MTWWRVHGVSAQTKGQEQIDGVRTNFVSEAAGVKTQSNAGGRARVRVAVGDLVMAFLPKKVLFGFTGGIHLSRSHGHTLGHTQVHRKKQKFTRTGHRGTQTNKPRHNSFGPFGHTTQHQGIVRPPSTARLWPVTALDASAAKRTHASAKSLTVVVLRSGVPAET